MEQTDRQELKKIERERLSRRYKTNYLLDLTAYATRYTPFVDDLPTTMSLRSFLRELGLEVDYQRELDQEQGINSRKDPYREGI